MDDGRDATVYNGPPFPPNEQNSDNPKMSDYTYLFYLFLFILFPHYNAFQKKYSLSPPTNSKGYSRWAELHTVRG